MSFRQLATFKLIGNSSLLMQIVHHGGHTGVTGSCHQLFLSDTRSVLVDCGMFQGTDARKRNGEMEIDFPLDGVEGLVLTHVHIDHVGRIPHLFDAGFNKPIYCTKPTAKMLPIMLEDAMRLGITRNRQVIKAFLSDLKQLLHPMKYGEWKSLGGASQFRFQPAGHILGSAYVEFDQEDERYVFSGDLKLSNVLVHSSGKCKLVDFGLAAMADTSSDKAIADCPSARAIDYAALERGTGVRKGDTRSDIYFVGVMMYNVISGKQALVDTRERSQRLNVTRFHDFPSLSEVCRDLPEQIYTICNKALEFDPDKRYQTPNAMLADIQVALKSLENPNRVERRIGNRHDILAIDEEDAKEGEGKTVMVVENKQELQDVLREKLKKRGYKVLIFGDPERALSKFSPDESSPADCLVICAPDLGNLALDAFNRFAEQDHTKTIPAVMLVDPKQQHIIRGANTSPIHVLLPMPLKVRELRQALAKLTAR